MSPAGGRSAPRPPRSSRVLIMTAASPAYAICEACRTKRPAPQLHRDDSAPDGLARLVCCDAKWCDAQAQRLAAAPELAPVTPSAPLS